MAPWMTTVLGVALLAILVTMSMALYRAMKGPSVFDRIVAVNMFGTKTMLLIAVAGFFTGRPDFLDLALVYGLVSFVGTIAVLKFTRYGNIASDATRGTPGPSRDSSSGPK
jgi:multicomponent Na+:H+ antiporter subunit F